MEKGMLSTLQSPDKKVTLVCFTFRHFFLIEMNNR